MSLRPAGMSDEDDDDDDYDGFSFSYDVRFMFRLLRIIFHKRHEIIAISIFRYFCLGRQDTSRSKSVLGGGKFNGEEFGKG